MAQISFEMPDGSSRTATVDDGIKALPQEQQAAFVDHIRQTAISAKGVTPGQTDAANDSFTNDFKSAAGSAMSDTGSLVQGVGSALNSDTIKNAGGWLRDNAPTPEPGYTGRGQDFTKDLSNGSYLRAGGDLLHGAASGSAESIAELGGGALGGFLGNAPGAAAGAGLVGGAFALGRGGRLRAGQSAVSGSNLVDAAPAAAATGLVDAATMGRLPGGVLGRSVAMGAGGGANSAIGQYDATGKVDPDQVINDAASGAATGAIAETVPALRNAGRGSVENLMSRSAKYQPGSDTEAKSAARVYDDLLARKENATNVPGAPNDLNAVANSLKADYAADVTQRIRDANPEVRPVLNAAFSQALRHNNTTSEDLTSALGMIDSIDHGLSGEQAAALKDRLMDLNTVSRQSFKNSNVGPLQSLGQLAGRYGGAVAELAHGSPMGALALAGIGTTHMGNIAAKVGGGVGGLGDRALGTSVPPAILSGIAARRYLNGASVEPVTPFQARPEEAPEPVAAKPNPAPAGGFALIKAQQAMANANQPPAPSGPYGAAGGKAPPFVRPQVTPPAPEAAPVGPYGAPGKAPAGGFSLINQMKAKAEAEAADEPAIDPATGNAPDPIPVNTRISGKAARLAQATTAQSAPLPALKPDTAATVAQALHEDPMMAAAVSAAPRTDSPGSVYLQRGLGLGSHAEAVDLARRAEQAGVIPAGAADVIAKPSTIPSHGDDLAAIKQFHRLSQGFPQSGAQVDAQGQPIRSLPAYQAAHGEYHSSAQALAQQADAAVPGVGPAVLEVASTHGANKAETVALKRAAAREALDKLPPEQRSAASAYLLADALINHG